MLWQRLTRWPNSKSPSHQCLVFTFTGHRIFRKVRWSDLSKLYHIKLEPLAMNFYLKQVQQITCSLLFIVLKVCPPVTFTVAEEIKLTSSEKKECMGARWGEPVFSYELRYIGFWLVEMAISTNQKPTIYCNLYENTAPADPIIRFVKAYVSVSFRLQCDSFVAVSINRAR